MAETGIERPYKVRLSRVRLAHSLLRGATYADAAIAAGSKATDRAVLTSIGYRLAHSPSVQAFLAKRTENLETEWAKAVGWANSVLDGEEKATNLDKHNAANLIARASGKNTVKVEVSGKLDVAFRGFASTPMPRVVEAIPAMPALPEPSPVSPLVVAARCSDAVREAAIREAGDEVAPT